MSTENVYRRTFGDRVFGVIAFLFLAAIVLVIVVGLPFAMSLGFSQSRLDDSLTRADEPVLAPGEQLRTPEQARRWLRDWADALPEDSANHGRRTDVAVTVDPKDPQLWSVRTTLGRSAVPLLGWAGIGWPSLDAQPPVDKFRCIVVTSADSDPTVYPTAGSNGLFGDGERCDEASSQVRTVDPRYGTASLDADWSRLAEALGTEAGRANPYLTADSLETGLARYAVTQSQVVSTTETRLTVQQTATGTGQLSCADLGLETKRCSDPEPRTQIRTVIVSTGQAGTGPVTVGQPQEEP